MVLLWHHNIANCTAQQILLLRPLRSALTRVALLDPETLPLGDGAIEVRVKLTGATTTLRTGTWYRLIVRVEPDGWVRVLKGTSPEKLLIQHRFLAPGDVPSVVPGGVGLATTKAKAVFDDVVVWEDSALAPPPSSPASP